MRKIRNCETGFSTIELLITLVVLILIAGAGVLVYKNHHAKSDVSSTGKLTPSPTAKAQNAIYAGWKTYCDSSTGGCFRYPSSWDDVSASDAEGLKAFVQNKETTINVSYSEPVDGTGGLGSFVTNGVSALTATNSAYKVVGGYFTTGNNPGYNLVDSSIVQQYGLAAGKTTDINGSKGLYFTKGAKKAFLSVSYNNTVGSSSITPSQADGWFNSADGKTALMIAQSYYNK